MIDIVEAYLDALATPERAALLKRAHALFDSFELETYRDQLEQIVLTLNQPDCEIEDGLAYIEALTREYLLQILIDHGVRVDEDLPTAKMTNLAQALYDIQDYEDAQSVLDVCQLDDGDEIEHLAEILSFVSDITKEEFILDLLFVHPKLIMRLEEHFQERLVEVKSDTAATQENQARQDLNSLHGVIGKKTHVSLLIENGLALGLSLKSYLPFYNANSENWDNKQRAVEFYAFYLISSESQENPIELFEKMQEDIILQPNDILFVARLLRDLAVQFGTRNKS